MSTSESHQAPSGATEHVKGIRNDQETPCAECEQPIGWWAGHHRVCTPCMERIQKERWLVGDRPLTP